MVREMGRRRAGDDIMYYDSIGRGKADRAVRTSKREEVGGSGPVAKTL